jgi:hypothetical protein
LRPQISEVVQDPDASGRAYITDAVLRSAGRSGCVVSP